MFTLHASPFCVESAQAHNITVHEIDIEITYAGATSLSAISSAVLMPISNSCTKRHYPLAGTGYHIILLHHRLIFTSWANINMRNEEKKISAKKNHIRFFLLSPPTRFHIPITLFHSVSQARGCLTQECMHCWLRTCNCILLHDVVSNTPMLCFCFCLILFSL